MLLKSWPALAYHFGLYPDDLPRFSYAEWAQYVHALHELNESNRG